MNYTFKPRRRRTSALGALVILAPFLGLLALIVLGGFAYVGSIQDRTITVTGTERVCTGGSEGTTCKYMVFTAAEGTFENTDELFFFKFNSADYHGALSQLGTFNVRTVGWRVAFLSMTPNIIDYERVAPPAGDG